MGRWRGATICVGLVALSVSAAADDPAPRLQPIPTPNAEVPTGTTTLDLPNVPAFELPIAGTPRALRLTGARYVDTDVRVTGYVVWKYDCGLTIGEPGMSHEERTRLIADEPERCLLPHLYLGDAVTSSPAKSIWVAEVPRNSSWAVGDRITVTGRWATKSPRGFSRTTGLLVYGASQ